METRSTSAFTCHAGLECRVVPLPEQKLVAIVGRTFVKAENYRRATTRAITGDWSDHAPDRFFENVLLTASGEVIDTAAARVARTMPAQKVVATPAETKTADVSGELGPRPVEVVPEEPKQPARPQVSNIVARFTRELGLEQEMSRPRPSAAEVVESPQAGQPSEPAERVIERIVLPRPVPEEEVAARATAPAQTAPIEKTELQPQADDEAASRAAKTRAWRSFFGSILSTDYPKAIESILEFVGLQYGLESLIWLEKNDGRLENVAAYGTMKDRRVRLGISATDPRLEDAAKRGIPLKLAERAKPGIEVKSRSMSLFPVTLGGEIAAGMAVLEEIPNDDTIRHIARICQSVAPQLEILRLRRAVERSESLSTAVKRFGESVKQIDDQDLWLKLTQTVAEMLKAERASLMVYNERSRALELKAMIGGGAQRSTEEPVGARVARLVFDKNKPIIVPDVRKTGLPPVSSGRQYKTASFMSCPMTIGDRTIGVMSFSDKASGQPFDKASLNLFQAVAPQLAVALDRAALKDRAGELEQLSVTDGLTGLLNRRYLEVRLAEEVKRSNRHGFPMSVMMIDVDHFKSYNDQFGHPEGDEALRIVGRVVRDTLRGADIAARYGGEEFSILLPQTPGGEAAIIAERIRANVAETTFPHRRVTVSIGVASCTAELCSADGIVKAADRALYRAKELGRNQVIRFDQLAVAAR